MIFIAERCSGCRTCQLVCSLCHEGECNPLLARLAGKPRGTMVSMEFAPLCDGCALCAELCPYGAIEEDD